MFKWFHKNRALRASENLARKGQYDAALQALDSVLNDSPEDITLSIQKVWLLLELNNNEAAYKCLENSLEINPKHPILLMLLGEYHYKNQAFEEAKKSLTESLSMGPDNLRTEYNLGLCYLALGDHFKASQFFESSIRYDKNLVQSRLLTMAESYLLNQSFKVSDEK